MALDSVSGPTPQPASPIVAAGLAQAYPINVLYEHPARYNRFWAIPIVGILVKSIILIPHFIVLYILSMIVSLALLILWAPVLLGGKYPEWGYALLGGTLRWSARVMAFTLGLTDEYPPFTFRSSSEDGRLFSTQVQIEIPPRNSRWWAVPLLGYAVKAIILIPHLVVLSVLGSIAAILMLVLWIPVLFGGSYPDWGLRVVGGTMRWSTRFTAYLYGLTDRYPPFSLE